MKEILSVFKALSDQNRLRILCALIENKELCACQITSLIQVTGATASRHMSILLSSGLVTSRKEGRWVYYETCQKDPKRKVLFKLLTEYLRNDPVIADDVKSLREITSYTPAEFCERTREGKACSKKPQSH